MTYFKDHNGLTVMHRAAMEGSMLACEHILTIRGDAFHDTDKKVRHMWAWHLIEMTPPPRDAHHYTMQLWVARWMCVHSFWIEGQMYPRGTFQATHPWTLPI